MAVHNSSIPTTSLQIERTEATVTVPDYGGAKKSEAEAMIIDKWPQPTEFRSWKISFKNEVSQSSQYPRVTMLWIGEVEDVKTFDELITSTSTTGRQIPDFENLDFKIASGLGNVVTGIFQKQVTTAKGKAQSEETSVTGRQIAGRIYDFLKNSGDKEAIFEFRDLSKVQ